MNATQSCFHLVLAVSLVPLACGKQKPPPQPPAAEPVAAAPPAPVKTDKPAPPPPKVPEDALAIGTFNLGMAFDASPVKRTKKAQPFAAKNDDDWNWKRDRIVEILVAEKLDVVALQELGGEGELADINTQIREKGGYEYDTAWEASTDHVTGQQVAILSRFPLSNVRRLPVEIDRQVAVDVELPSGDTITVVNVILADGQQPAYASKRRKSARALKKLMVKSPVPMVLLGTMNTMDTSVDDNYAEETGGILSGKGSKSEADDCQDSVSDAAQTTTNGHPLDRIFACGLEMRRATISQEDKIVREETDPWGQPWPSIPIAEAPHRDVSGHYLVWAEVARPKKPEPPKPAADAGAATEPAPAAGG